MGRVVWGEFELGGEGASALAHQRSEPAILVNTAIRRPFVRLWQLLATQKELAQRLERLEWRQSEQEGRVQYVFEAIQQLIEAPAEVPPKRRIGLPTSQTGPERVE
jgi:hypothetical protein